MNKVVEKSAEKDKVEQPPPEETKEEVVEEAPAEEAVVSSPVAEYNPYDKRPRRLNAILNGSTTAVLEPAPVTSDVTEETEEVKE